MPIPGMSYVTLTGTFTNLKTTLPSVGQLRFTMPFQLVNTTTNTIVVPEDFAAILDTNGQFSISLPCTDDPDFVPVDRYWSVTEMVDGHNRTYAIQLPASPSSADLADIAPVDPVDPAAVYTLIPDLSGYLVNVTTLTPPLVLDGSTDNLAAFNTATTAGFRRFFFPTGTALFSTYPTLPAGTELVGLPDHSSVIKIANGANTALLYANTSNITLHRLVFDGGTQSTPTNSVLIDGVDGFSITWCRFRNMETAIRLNDSVTVPKNGRIEHNYFEPCKDVAIWGSGRTDPTVYIGHNTIENVTAGTGGGPTPTAGIILNGNGTVEDNTVLASADTGIELVSTNSTSAIIRHNHVHSTLVAYFIGSGATGYEIVGNEGSSTSDFGMHFKDGRGSPTNLANGRVVLNWLHDCGKSGIVDEGMDGLELLGNLIQRVGLTQGAGVGPTSESRSGLVVTTSSPGSVSAKNTIVDGNIINDQGGPGFMEVGLLVEASDPSILVGPSNAVAGAFNTNFFIVPALPFNNTITSGLTGLAVDMSGPLVMPASTSPAFYNYRLAAALDITGGSNGTRGDNATNPALPANSTDATFANGLALFMEHNGVGLIGKGSAQGFYGRFILGPHPSGAYGELGALVLGVTNNRPGGLAECIEVALTVTQAGRNAIQTAILTNNTPATGGYWARGLWVTSAGSQPGTEGLFIDGVGGWSNFLRFVNAVAVDVLRIDNTGKFFFIGGGTLTPSGSDHQFSGNLITPAVVASVTVSTPKIQYSGDATRFESWGTGSPEGVVAAGVSSTYHRLDGGAGTSFYVKESGSGSTGWVGK